VNLDLPPVPLDVSLADRPLVLLKVPVSATAAYCIIVADAGIGAVCVSAVLRHCGGGKVRLECALEDGRDRPPTALALSHTTTVVAGAFCEHIFLL
jgi:hypothetical protein